MFALFCEQHPAAAMFISRKAVATAVIALSSSSSSSSCFINFATKHSSIVQHLGVASTKLGDTDLILPDFANKEEYEKYMIAAGQLPAGFAVGTAKGTFVSVEAPSMGDLPIRATIIHLTEGPTDSWAAVFTSNKVRL